MADEVKGITIRTEYLTGLKMLTDEQRGRLLIALFADSGCCDMPDLDAMTRMVFELVIPSVRLFQDAYERQRMINAENGRKGGRPRKQSVSTITEQETEKPVGFDNNQSVSEKTIGFSVKSEKPTELIRTEPNGTEQSPPTSLTTSLQDTPPAPARTRHFRVPTVSEVQAYCDERKNGIDGQVFVDFYQARGWKLKTGPMRDWKAAVRTWEQRRAEQDRIDPRGLRHTQSISEHNAEVTERVRAKLKAQGVL